MYTTQGIVFFSENFTKAEESRKNLLKFLKDLGLDEFISSENEFTQNSFKIKFKILEEIRSQYFPNYSTINTAKNLKLNPHKENIDLQKEIVLALLSSPVLMEYESFEDLESSIRVRINIVNGAIKTFLNFDTVGIERPFEFWTYSESTGFIIKNDKPIIEALIAATQPTYEPYSFSCYRATEYVLLLAIALEAEKVSPQTLIAIEKQWHKKAISSGLFHDTFLVELGTQENPLPINYFIPGDRIWFRNPDDASSNIEGYEGSWVFYLGDGLFSNFWKRESSFTLLDKLLEIYHWRHGIKVKNGEPYIDEIAVAELVSNSKNSQSEVERIYTLMHKFKDPRGVSKNGGAMDTTREYAKSVFTNQIKFTN